MEEFGSARRQQGGFEDEPRGERGRDWDSLASRDVAMAQNEDLWKVLCARAEQVVGGRRAGWKPDEPLQFWIKSEADGLKNAASMCQLAQENILNLTGRKNEDLER